MKITDFFIKIIEVINNNLKSNVKKKYDRYLPFNENLKSRWDRAREYGFGFNTSVYDNCYVFGDVTVGSDCWIGPNTILDGSGCLKIGNFVTISMGCQVYSHNSIVKTLSSNREEIKKNATTIGNNVYLAPNCIINKGVKIGNFCVVANGSYVNKNINDYTIVAGNPAKEIGEVKFLNNKITLNYF